jgi:TonB family protein
MPIGPLGGPMHPARGQHKSFQLFLLGILLLHGAVMLVQVQSQLISEAPKQSEVIKLKLVQEVLKPESRLKKQLVQSEDSAQQKKTENAFLSDKDRYFDRQTMANKIDSFNRAAKGNATQTVPAISQQSRQKSKTALKDLKLTDIGMMANEPMPQEIGRAPASLQQKGMENGDPLMQGLSATNDYVEEVALGDFTHLNTVEYKYYGFFHRIRQKLEQFWGKSIQEKAHALFRSGRRLPASENLITSLQITLNERGEIVGVKILGASGVKELDDAAIESFNQAGPFPNPPKDMLVNGKAVIQWGFVVKS